MIEWFKMANGQFTLIFMHLGQRVTLIFGGKK
jgi:hypothetical protein